MHEGATGRQREYIEAVDSETAKLTEIVEDLLSLSRIELADYRFTPELFPVQDALLTSMVNNQGAAHARRITLSTEFEGSLPEVFADRESVIDITNRLISNAIKFSPDESEIVIGAKAGGRDDDSSIVQIYVSDSGPGVPLDRQDMIFEKYVEHELFSESALESVGLGLPICKQLAEMNNGRIALDSTGESGSTFSFFLPVDKEQKA
jgi:signal transduction histidine kinase